MHFSMKNFPEEFIKQKDIKNRYKAILCSTYNQTENTLFSTFRVPLVLKWVQLHSHKTFSSFILCQGSMYTNFKRIDKLEQKFLHRNNYILPADGEQPQQYRTTNILYKYKSQLTLLVKYKQALNK